MNCFSLRHGQVMHALQPEKKRPRKGSHHSSGSKDQLAPVPNDPINTISSLEIFPPVKLKPSELGGVSKYLPCFPLYSIPSSDSTKPYWLSLISCVQQKKRNKPDKKQSLILDRSLVFCGLKLTSKSLVLQLLAYSFLAGMIPSPSLWSFACAYFASTQHGLELLGSRQSETRFSRVSPIYLPPSPFSLYPSPFTPLCFTNLCFRDIDLVIARVQSPKGKINCINYCDHHMRVFGVAKDTERVLFARVRFLSFIHPLSPSSPSIFTPSFAVTCEFLMS